MSAMDKYLVTQTLISSYGWMFKKEGGEEDFLSTLRREHQTPTKAMTDGIVFENMVQAYCEGFPPEPTHKWEKGVKEVGEIVKGGAYQVSASRELEIDGKTFVVYGKIDFLKNGIIYDTKFSTTYHLNKYLDSPQHSFYLFMIPEAREFQYLVCDGHYVYKERYEPWQCESVEKQIREFLNYLDKQNLSEVYYTNWTSKY